jgi:hypothetical protein
MSISNLFLLAQGQTQGSAPRVHQQALTTGPFRNTCEADAVSPEVAMRGLQDRDVYNQKECKVDSQQPTHNNLVFFIFLQPTVQVISQI